MSGRSSARPERLLHFDLVVQAMADGLAVRCRALQEAVDAYRAGCPAPYSVECADGVAEVDRARGRMRVLGTWTRGVGLGFRTADAVDVYVTGHGASPVVAVPDSTIVGFLGAFADPYLGVPTRATPPPGQAEADRRTDAQTDEPEWLRRTGRVATPATAATVGSGVATFLSANRPPAQAGESLAESAGGIAANVVGRGAIGLQVALVAHHQWQADRGLGQPSRLGRATTEAVVVGGGGVLGSELAAPVGALAAGPLGAVGAGFLGNLGGTALGSAAADRLPWMAPGPHDPRHPDAEHNDVAAAIEGEGDDDEEEDDPAFEFAAHRFVTARDPSHPADGPPTGPHPPTGTTQPQR